VQRDPAAHQRLPVARAVAAADVEDVEARAHEV
jgi:hypothetical protein